jgi:hypothetical protein
MSGWYLTCDGFVIFLSDSEYKYNFLKFFDHLWISIEFFGFHNTSESPEVVPEFPDQDL